MKQYFYARGGERVGPVDRGELSRVGLHASTLVWHEGLADWQPAGELPELSDLFGEQPPPAPTDHAYRPPGPTSRRGVYDALGGPPPKTYLLESILATILCCLPLGIVGIVNAAKVEGRYYAGDLGQARYYSREARKWTKYSVVVMTVIYGLGILFKLIGSASVGSF